MNQPFQITIPADVLVEKVNSYPMVLWVLLQKHDGSFVDLFTDEEKETFIEAANWSDKDDCPTRIEKVELTLGNLLYQESGDDQE